MPFTLRPMEPRDVPVVVAIDRLSFPTPWSAAAFRRELQKEESTYSVLLKPEGDPDQTVADPGSSWLQRLFNPAGSRRVIGYVGFRLQERRGHITTIALHPDWRGRGFGDLLLSVALQRLVTRGAEMVTLEMRPSNKVAYQLYRKYGFRVVRFRPDYYQDGEDAWVMSVEVGEDYRERLAKLRDAVNQRLERRDIEVGQIDGDPL